MSDGTIQGLLFDLDQTLFDRAAAFRSCVNAGLDRVGCPLDQRAGALREIHSVDLGGYRSRRLLLRCLAGRFGWKGSDLEGAFREALLPHVRLSKGVRATLRRLKLLGRPGPGLRLGLLTDGSTVTQSAKIEQLGLAHEFDRVQISGSFGRSKPDPKAFLAFADEWQLAPESLCMVGDHRVRDIDGARRAGLQAVWIGESGSHRDPEVMHATSVAGLDRHPVMAPRLPQLSEDEVASVPGSQSSIGAFR